MVLWNEKFSLWACFGHAQRAAMPGAWIEMKCIFARNMEEAIRGSWQLGSRVVRELGSVSERCRNFSGQFRLSQFPLHLRHVEVLGPQTSKSSWFFLHKKHVQRSAFQNKRMAFWPEKFSRDFREIGPQTRNLVTPSSSLALTTSWIWSTPVVVGSTLRLCLCIVTNWSGSCQLGVLTCSVHLLYYLLFV